MIGQYLIKKLKLNFCYSVLKRQFFLTSKQGLNLNTLINQFEPAGRVDIQRYRLACIRGYTRERKFTKWNSWLACALAYVLECVCECDLLHKI
jgi:hypothetical protein